MLYPQNGDSSATIDSVTSLHRIYTRCIRISDASARYQYCSNLLFTSGEISFKYSLVSVLNYAIILLKF